jgi:hypothetical protein
MAQLQQRVSFSIRIEQLNCEEIDAYVDHRLAVAGYKGSSLFSAGARLLLAQYSQGIPRNINNICFCAMSLACATGAKTIDREMMSDVLADLDLGPLNEQPVNSSQPVGQPAPAQLMPKNISAPALTLSDEPARGRAAKVTFGCVMLLALGWSAVHFNLGQRLRYHLHNISAVENSYAKPAVSHDSSMDINPNATDGAAIQDVPVREKSDEPLPIRRAN